MIETYNPNKPSHHFIIGILAVILALPGIILLFNGVYFGFIPVLLWLSLLTIKNGVQINEQSKKVLIFKEYLWFRFYNNFSLDDYKSFKIRKSREAYTLNTRVQSMNVNNEYLVIEILNSKTQKFKSLAFGDNEDIMGIADKLENDFGLQRRIKK